jgi:hypothetical protein
MEFQYRCGITLRYKEILYRIVNRGVWQMSLPGICQAVCITQVQPERQYATVHDRVGVTTVEKPDPESLSIFN